MPCSFCLFVRRFLIGLFIDILPAIATVIAFVRRVVMGICSDTKAPPRPNWRCPNTVRHPTFFRPDPMIYDQYYLMSLGLAVSWQNPDIVILQNGAPVASAYDLQPATTYIIRATIYNASTTGVVYQMPVFFSYLSFGVGTVSHPIPGPSPTVNLGVKGTPEGIATVEKNWTTPATPGHYCVQVSFAWPDDANPNNNLGQENTQVVAATSPAPVQFRLRNTGPTRRTFRFEYDTFQIPPQPTCPPAGTLGATAPGETVSAATRARNSRANSPLPEGWTLDLNPATPELDAGGEITVSGVITPPDTFTGTMPVNIHTFSGRTLIGGVTLTVTRN
jgi:hypothetical protein